MKNNHAISIRDIESARSRIAQFVHKTPLRRSAELSRRLGTDVRLKLESMQDTGSFKIRGAANRILKLCEEKQSRGVVAFSSGNHGKSVAHVARRLGIPATVYMTDMVPENKVEAIRALGATICIHGKDQDEAEIEAIRVAEQGGLDFVPPFDNADIIAGQGTIGLEILEQWPEVQTLLIPLSGGGLLSGIAVAAKAIKPDIRIIGVSCSHSAAMHDSIEAGHIVDSGEKPSLADALPGPIGESNQFTYSLCSSLIDDMVKMEEADIAQGMLFALEHERLVLEGAGAIGIAHLLSSGGGLGENLAVVCSGDNVDINKLLSLKQNDFSRSGK